MYRGALAIVIVAAFAFVASADPSFDCTKARSAAETTICFPEVNLAWFDRQLSRLFKLAKAEPSADRDRLIGDQRKFLALRDACGAHTTCMERRYKTRLFELGRSLNVAEPFAEFYSKDAAGSLYIARFGYSAAFKMATVGGNGHVCRFEVDDVSQGGKGVLRFRERDGGFECRIDVIPQGEDMRVDVEGCRLYCGARAGLGGLFKRVR